MKCPNCGVFASAGALECAGCGVIFSKLKEKKERVKRDTRKDLAAVASEEAPLLPKIDPWKARAAASAIVAFWFLVLGFYYRRVLVAAQIRATRREVRDRPVVLLRDPASGDLKQIPVVKSPSTGHKFGDSSSGR